MGVEVAALQGFACAVLNAAGATPGDAASLAQVLVWADAVGRTEQGVERLPILCQRLEKRLMKSPAAFVWSPPGAALRHLDAAEGIGHLAAAQATAEAIELGRGHGLGAVTVSNSNYFGAAGYYAWLIAQAGMVGLVASNSFPKVAAPGSVKALLGTNPLAFAAPILGDHPLLVDLATSAVAGSEIRRRKALGLPLDLGMAIDARGNPLLDPAEFGKGVALPFGGARGFGIMLLVEVLTGVLSGGAMASQVNSMYNDWQHSGRSCHFILALDPRRVLPEGQFEARMLELKSMVESSGEAARLPGATRWAYYAESLRNGIDRRNLRVDELSGLGAQYGVPATFLDAPPS